MVSNYTSVTYILLCHEEYNKVNREKGGTMIQVNKNNKILKGFTFCIVSNKNQIEE